MRPRISEVRPPAFFLAGSPALDFLNTIAGPWGVKIEWIADGKDLIDWLSKAGLVSQASVDQVSSQGLPGQLDLVATEARALREWFRQFVNDHKGKPLTPKAIRDLQPINDLLANDESYLSIEPRGKPVQNPEPDDESPKSALKIVRHRRMRSPSSLLIPLAESMAELVATEDFTHVKKCECEPCTMLMVDNTRHHSRRWCSMALCGNRMKIRAHRNRLDVK